MGADMTIALGVLGVALAAAVWWLSGGRREAERSLAQLRTVRRHVENVRADLERGLTVTRAHLADVAENAAPPRDIILRGAAFRSIEAAPAMVLSQQQPDLFVLDVRTPAEFNAGHIPGAHSIPLDELDDRVRELPARDRPVLVVGAAGGRSAQASEVLAEHGFTRLLNLAGGMHAWTGPRDRDASIPPPPPSANTGTAINFRGGSLSQSQVVEAISQGYDPQTPINVYDLGLIYDIDIDESQIAVRMTLTSEGCPSARQIPAEVKQRIAA